MGFPIQPCWLPRGFRPPTLSVRVGTQVLPQSLSTRVLNDFSGLLLGRDPFDIEVILADLDHRLRGMNQAKAAIDCALHEIAARSLGVPLCTLFGGKLRTEFPVLRVLSLKRPDKMASKARELIHAGYRDIKIKVDGQVDLDAARVRAIRDAVDAGCRIFPVESERRAFAEPEDYRAAERRDPGADADFRTAEELTPQSVELYNRYFR